MPELMLSRTELGAFGADRVGQKTVALKPTHERLLGGPILNDKGLPSNARMSFSELRGGKREPISVKRCADCGS